MNERPLTARDFDPDDPEPDRVIRRRKVVGAPLGAPPTAYDYHMDKMDRQWNATLAEANRKLAERRAAEVDEATRRAIRQAEYDHAALRRFQEDRRAGKFGAVRPREACERLKDYKQEHPAYQERIRQLLPGLVGE